MKLLAMPKLRQVLESILAAMNSMHRWQFACIPFWIATFSRSPLHLLWAVKIFSRLLEHFYFLAVSKWSSEGWSCAILTSPSADPLHINKLNQNSLFSNICFEQCFACICYHWTKMFGSTCLCKKVSGCTLIKLTLLSHIFNFAVYLLPTILVHILVLWKNHLQ